MSTRCQIDFISKWKDDKDKIHEERNRVYRHSDGYPEGVLPDLKEFLKWNEGRNSDIEYMTANFIFWNKRKHEDEYFNKDLDGKDKDKNLKWDSIQSTNTSILHIGFGVCDVNSFHGDIEYFYEIITDENGKVSINVYKVPSWDSKSKDDFKLMFTCTLAQLNNDKFMERFLIARAI